MQCAASEPGCPYLYELIALLDEEAEPHSGCYRLQLAQAMRDLELGACLAGASALTVALIHVSQRIFGARERMPRLH